MGQGSAATAFKFCDLTADTWNVRGFTRAGLVLQDASGRILVASERAAQLLEVDGPEALTGRPALFEGGSVVRSNGSELPAEEQPGAMAISTAQAQHDIVLGFRPAGGAIRWFQVRAQPLFKVASSVPYAAVSRFVLLPNGPEAYVDRPGVGRCRRSLHSERAQHAGRSRRIGLR
jgi:PAS domain-containing protein